MSKIRRVHVFLGGITAVSGDGWSKTTDVACLKCGLNHRFLKEEKWCKKKTPKWMLMKLRDRKSGFVSRP